MDNYGEILIYQSEDGLTKIEVKIQDETVWLTQQQMADLFQTSRTNVVEHIAHIYEEFELDENSICRKFRQVRKEGNREVSREMSYYNLDMIISLGYRVKSRIATNFRRWATERLKEYMIKGFTMDNDRLKNLGGGNYWKELLDRIRDIRSSEKVMYRQVLDLYATSVDYNPKSSESIAFFKMVQNKLHYAAHGHTAAEKNIILQGAPGVGKTFAAKRLAYSIMGEMDDERIEFVQFHQNYSYEDFMMGYKPVNDGFELKYGIFYRFCQKAANHPDKDYFFIIDEINRGNMSKIFGELLMLIEADYRDKKAVLAYNGLEYSVPKRLHIIGMMNTADRSLAMIDYALRRRFSFFDMEPGFDSEGFINYQKGFANDTFNTLIERMKELNKEIMQDKSLGKGFCIGHSYFCNAEECTDEWMKDVVDFDILPMLSEYWFDEPAKLQRWENILHGIFQ